MDLTKGGRGAIERMVQAYGFKTRQQLCNQLGVSKSTLATRYMRDSFPAEWVIQCAVETGVSLEWLISGVGNIAHIAPPKNLISVVNHTKNESSDAPIQDEANVTNRDSQDKDSRYEISVNFNRGGKAAIERMLQAYGFTTKQALSTQLGISNSTLANRYLRDTFPADFIIHCALETGVSLEWLALGIGDMYTASLSPASPNKSDHVTIIPRKKMMDGVLADDGILILDKTLLPGTLHTPLALACDNALYLIEQQVNEIRDGTWLVVIEGKIAIRSLTRIPVGKVRINASNPLHSFECKLNDIEIIGKVVSKTEFLE
ncbi:helix-turn-helix domain-containing protein [Edwardsiella tarda]